MPYRDADKRKEYGRKWATNRHKVNREKAFAIVGEKCVRCSQDDKRVLEFDHIVPILRSKSGVESGRNLARKIANGQIGPSEIQVLCGNCHTIKTYYPEEFKL